MPIQLTRYGSGAIRAATGYGPAPVALECTLASGALAMSTDLPSSSPKEGVDGEKPQPAQAPLAQWRSEQILVGQREVLIQHGEETYRLRLTRAGKLILYK